MSGIEAPAQRRLDAARLVSVGALAVLAQFAVHMPEGYFGPGDQVTATGLLFSGAVVALVALSALATLGRVPGRRLLVPVLLALDVGAFVPGMASDPLLSGIVIVWHLAVAARFFFPAASIRGLGSQHRHVLAPRDPASSWLHRNGPAARHLAGSALLATIAVVGFELGSRVPASLVCLALDVVSLAVAAPLMWRLRTRPGFTWAIAACVVAAAALLPWPTLALVALAAAQLLLLLLLVTRARLFREVLETFYGHPALLVLTSFLLLIAIGTLFLSFPAAAPPGQRIGVIDAAFTATSAVCVTGLIVLDTPSDFSPFGQAVILALFQVGGLNIMVLSTFAALLLGRGLGLRGERALGELLDIRTPRAAYRLIGFIVAATVVVEAVGATLLTASYRARGLDMAAAAWRGIFHAVSAFCNAGFSLHSDSLVRFQEDPFVLLVMAALITVGGLGFVVLAFVARGLGTRETLSLALQSRIVLSTSAALTVLGAAGYALGEWQRSLSGLAAEDKLLNALFQSVTLRTAGFNSVELTDLQPATVLLMMALMFIGASPGGTGGGIKTTTAVILLGAIPAMVRGESRVVLARRTVPLETVYRSAAIAVVAALVIFGASSLLLASQALPFRSVLFEVFSAMGTVGLSLGVTPGLDGFGKTVVMGVMLIGRVGPLTLALLLARHRDRGVGYPEARIMVG